MGDIYSSKETWLIIGIIYIISLVISIIYLLYYVDGNQISYIILIICIIYFSLFIFLNIIAIFDLVFKNKDGFEKLFKFITNFYLVFNLVSKILGIVIFTIWISYLESGYYTKWKKFFDAFFRIYHKIREIWKNEKWKIIVILIIAAIIMPTLLILFIIFKKDLNLEIINYFCIFFDIYAITQIYINVGFFIVQWIIDFKRQRNKELIEKYYKYSKRKIIDETEKYFDNIKYIYGKLKKIFPTFEQTQISSPYYLYFQGLIKEVQEKMKLYDLE